MCSKRNGHMACCACIRTTGIMEGEGMAYCSCYSSLSRSYSQFSAIGTTCEKSTLTNVYNGRKFQNKPATAVLPHVSAENSHMYKGLVYCRRKHYNPVVLFPTGVLENAFPNCEFSGVHASSLRSEKSYLAMENHIDHEAFHEIEGVRSSASVVICGGEPVLRHSGGINGCLAEQHGSDVKSKGDKNVELHSVDDSCSSSMINMDAASASLKMEVDENGECSSSSAFVGELKGEDMSEKDLCISILKSHGLLSCLMPKTSYMSKEDIASCSGVANSISCNVCGLLGTAKNLLICDQCDEAFHVSCCNPAMRKTSLDEWFCQHCLKKKHKILKETNGLRSTVVRSELSFRPAASEAKTSPIALMLKENEPYTTGVRIGKDFQAVVPCWSGPIAEGTDVSEEPVELDPSYISKFHEFSSEKLQKAKPISNWLQCRDVIVGAGDSEGTVCGKWRRAPIFKVQTDNWDCFSSILWDPVHADCAVPQELETKEVLKQLKYIEMLRPRLEAKKRKSYSAVVNDSPTIVCALRADQKVLIPAQRTVRNGSRMQP